MSSTTGKTEKRVWLFIDAQIGFENEAKILKRKACETEKTKPQ